VKENIEMLLEDYKRRLNTVNDMLIDFPSPIDYAPERYQRYKVKASCYRTIISELERILFYDEK